jgi:hypothetical protein
MTRVIRTSSLCAVAVYLASSPAFAGQQTGKIALINADKFYNGGIVAISLSGSAPTGQPACATDTTRFSLIVTDGNPLNAYMMSVFTTALATGREVIVTGTGQCTGISNVEDIEAVRIAL